MTISKKDEDNYNKTARQLFADTSHKSAIGTLNKDCSVNGGKKNMRFTKVFDPHYMNMLELRTMFDSKYFDLVLVHNTLILKKSYQHARQMRKIMHLFDGRDVQELSEIRVSQVANKPVCFKIKDAVGVEPALWFVVAPVVNKTLTDDLLEQIKRVVE